ncbi:MAG: GTP cyclohydrolase I FolE [Alphaproteobacteria bacterium]|jgi:GTP cyclohydrolase I|nr:GTP cyclohydrolase I FolE [Alphaproteobacteria bacterium]MBP7729828.1 GTP cyclohydrolase I FolE [Alphaproteobacteria bacterium]MDP3444377.1 GTP cyclohydrolase I FolE [Ignavibacteria bacterium]
MVEKVFTDKTPKDEVNMEEFNQQEQKVHSYLKQFITLIGDDPEREGLIDTPKRVITSRREIFIGYKQDPKEILARTFDAEGYKGLILCKDIEFYSVCEHHMEPIIGSVHIGYVPNERVVGLSKLPRLVDCFAKRLQVQERMTNQIAHAIQENLNVEWVGVIIKAKHLCVSVRGVNKQFSTMVTSVFLGEKKDDKTIKEEFLRLLEH